MCKVLLMSAAVLCFGGVRAEFSVCQVELNGGLEFPLLAAGFPATSQPVQFGIPMNGRKALAFVIANRSDRFSVFRAVVEQVQEDNESACPAQLGFSGFPRRQLRMLKALPAARPSATMEEVPLVEMDESSTISIPAGGCGLVCCDIDIRDVLPRTYQSVFHVKPLGCEGEDCRIPIAMDVLSYRLPGLDARRVAVGSPLEDERSFSLVSRLGVHDFCIDPQLFRFELGADGNFDLGAYPMVLRRLDEMLTRHRKWAVRNGVECRWVLSGDVRGAFRNLYGLALGSEREERLWRQWLRAVKWKFNNFGFPDECYSIDHDVVNRRIVNPDKIIDRSLGIALPNIRYLRSYCDLERLCGREPVKTECSKDKADVVVYGATSAGLAAAVQVRRMGLTCIVLEPTSRIGGLTTGGLGSTDVGNKDAIGGLARRFYRDVASYYADPKNWRFERRRDYLDNARSTAENDDDSMWAFEPSAALEILESWEKTENLTVLRKERLDRTNGVEMEAGRITAIRMESGLVLHGSVFIDASYEGDLMALAGVSYAIGRESNAIYGETLNGIQRSRSAGHQFINGISAYRRAGDSKSGLLPGVEADIGEPDGSGDHRVQAYCYRMCLTDDPTNMIPFAKPEGYREEDYELLFRNLAGIEREGRLDDWGGLPWGNMPMPNRKTDTNNRTAFSLDFIGGNWNYPEASYAEREIIEKRHQDYQMGLMWTLANHPRVPEFVRKEVARWGTCRDEFVGERGNGWQNQLYVREARRMVGEYVMTEANCRGARLAPHPVAMAAYTMDSHHVRRYADKDGNVRNEGDVQVSTNAEGERFPPYPIDYGAIVPKRGECQNLLVPVCLSASHIAFGSIRMEPVFFELGQASGAAAALVVKSNGVVQDLPYRKLRDRLLADGQVLTIK